MQITHVVVFLELFPEGNGTSGAIPTIITLWNGQMFIPMIPHDYQL